MATPLFLEVSTGNKKEDNQEVSYMKVNNPLRELLCGIKKPWNWEPLR